MTALKRIETGAGRAARELYEATDAGAGLRAWIVLDDPARGAAFGGIRRRRYPSDDDARRDAVRLAEQMSLKTRLAGLPCGGGKTVILDHPDLDRAAVYRALGEAIATLDGRYFCGPDVGTDETDLDHVRSACRHVNARANRPGRSTARGVLAAMRACLAHLHGGDARVAGRHVVVQGLGSVGASLAASLAEEGARLSVADVDPHVRNGVIGRLGEGVLVREADEVCELACDVLAPCAVGPVVTADAIDRLRCAVLCGSANGQLEDPHLARALHDRGVLYAPDFAVNAGAVIEGVLVATSGASRVEVDRAVDAIGERLAAILAAARETGRTPLEAALEAAGGNDR